MAGARKGQPSKRMKRGPEEDRMKRPEEDRAKGAKPRGERERPPATEGLTDSDQARLDAYLPRMRGWQ